MLCLTNDKKLKHEKFFEKRSTKLKSLSLLEFTRKKIGGSRVSKRIALFRGMIWRFGERGARVLAWSCHLVDYPGHVIRHPRRGFEKKNRKGWGKKKKRKKREERGKKRGKWANKHADAWRMPIDFHFRSRKSRGCVSSTLRRVRIVLGRIVWMGKRTHIRLSEQLDSVSFSFFLSFLFFFFYFKKRKSYSNSILIRGFVDCGSI